MPNCVVKGCKNQSSKNKKQDGITFHTFPSRNKKKKEKWIAVIRQSRNEEFWYPSFRSVVCSAHFQTEDLCYTAKGLRRVKENAYPKILPGLPEQIDDEHSNEPSPTSVQTTVSIVPELLFSNSNQPSTSSTVQGAVPKLLFPDLSQPSTSNLVQVAVPQLPFLDLSQPSTSCAFKRVLAAQDFLETLEKDTLRKRVLFLETKLKKYKKNIKTLNQKVRRLTEKNKSLKESLKNT